MFNRKSKANQQREAIMAQIREAGKYGQCIILGKVKGGTRVIVLGQPPTKLETEVNEIVSRKFSDKA